MTKLTPRQQQFCDEYLIDLNATRAYKAVYKSCKRDETANVNGSKLLRNTKVMEYISERKKAISERTEITQDMVIKELASVAFANGTDYAKITKDGVNIVPTDALNSNQKAAIVGIKTTQTGIEIKLADKLKALELLGKHLGVFEQGASKQEGAQQSEIFTALSDMEESK